MDKNENRNVPQVPACCKSYEVYAKLSQNLEKTHPLASFFLRRYIADNVMKLLKTSARNEQGVMEYIELNINEASRLKPEHYDPDVQLTEMQDFCMEYFSAAQQDDDNRNFNMSTVTKFFTTGLLFDALGETLTQEEEDIRAYAKQKAFYIRKCLSANIEPKSGPLDSEALAAIGKAPAASASQHSTSQQSSAMMQNDSKRFSEDETLPSYAKSASIKYPASHHTNTAIPFSSTTPSAPPPAQLKNNFFDFQKQNSEPLMAAPPGYALAFPDGEAPRKVSSSQSLQPEGGAGSLSTFHTAQPEGGAGFRPAFHAAQKVEKRTAGDFDEMLSRSKVMDSARKEAQFAISALNYGTVEDAIGHLQNAASLLEPFRESR